MPCIVPRCLSASARRRPGPKQVFDGSRRSTGAGELVSWDVAEQRCVDWGGHLAKEKKKRLRPSHFPMRVLYLAVGRLPGKLYLPIP